MLRRAFRGLAPDFRGDHARPPRPPGVLQTRAEGVLDYRTGRSAMILYACSGPGETLRGFVAGRGARELARAVTAGARWIRFARGRRRPRTSWIGCCAVFVERFGVAAHQQRRRPAAAPSPPTGRRERRMTRPMASDNARPHLPRRRRRHRRGRRAGRAHQAARTAHHAPRGHGRPGRLRRPVRPARPATASRCWCPAPTAWAPS